MPIEGLELSEPRLVADVQAWFDALPEGAFKQVAKFGVFGCPGLRILEVRQGAQVIAYASYAFDPGGVYWHHVLVEEPYRRHGIAEKLFGALLADTDAHRAHGQPAVVSARGVRDDGRKLMTALGFEDCGDEEFKFSRR